MPDDLTPRASADAPDTDGPDVGAPDMGMEAASFQSLHPVFADAPAGVTFRKLRKRLVRQTQEAIRAYGMLRHSAGGASDQVESLNIRGGQKTDQMKRPRWLVCLSGGKDSYTLLSVLLDLQWQGALPVDILACNLDQGQPGFPKDILPNYFSRIGVPHRIITQDTYSVVTEKVPASNTYCSLCSRMRRGILYRVAREEGCEAVVLGHHRDDSLETFMLNFLHGGRMSAMPPKLVNDAGDLFVLRPLILCAEDDIRKFAGLMQFPIIPCNLCGSQEGLQRMQIKSLLDEWEKRNPGKRQIMSRGLSHVRPSHLMDSELFDFAGLDLGAPGTKDDGL